MGKRMGVEECKTFGTQKKVSSLSVLFTACAGALPT